MNGNDFKLINKVNELLGMLEEDLKNFPKKHIELKSNLLNRLYEIQKTIYIVNNLDINIERKIDKGIDMLEENTGIIYSLNFLVDLAFDLNTLSKNKYVKIGALLGDVRKYHKGWYNYLNTLKKAKQNDVLKP